MTPFRFNRPEIHKVGKHFELTKEALEQKSLGEVIPDELGNYVV
jgi:hypothetical protein